MPDLPTTEELQAFVGPNADYYLAAWEPSLAGTGTAHSTAKWVFLVPLFWLALRGMSGTAIVIAALCAVVQFIVEVLAVLAPESAPLLNLIAVFVAIALSVICVVKGNEWYLQYACEEIAHIRTKNLPEQEHLAAITARGGLRVEQLLVYFVVALMMLIAAATGGQYFGRIVARW